MHKYLVIAAAVAGSLLAGCSANGNAQPPLSAQPVPLAQIGVLQFAVGTANLGNNANALGLNTVATFRQTNGLTAALVNSPTITGPVGFVVPACGTGCVDTGTTHMSAAPQNIDPNVANPVTVFGQTNGVFSYGIAPDNSGVAGSVAFGLNNQPFFPSAGALKYVGGPPAYPFFKDGTFPSSFIGYTQGFTSFNITPVTGTYTLTDVVASGNAGTATFTATSALSNLTPLPNLALPTFVKDGAGGGTGTVTVPVDARVVETMVYFNDTSLGTWFAVGPIRGTGAQPYTLPDFLGPCGGAAGVGCQNNSTTRRPTLNTGDSFAYYAVTYDYPMFEAGPPGNTSQTPVINGGAATSNQADLTASIRSATLVY